MPAAPHKSAPRKRKRTKTSPFGAPGRVNHDASPFYASRLYDSLRDKNNGNLGVLGSVGAGPGPAPTAQNTPISDLVPYGRGLGWSVPAHAPTDYLDRLFCKSCEQMSELPDGSVHLMVTSPPSTAWGSWQSAANPTLRDVHEYILVCSKGTFSRKRPPDPALHLCR